MKIVVAMVAYLLPKTVILVAQPWSATPDALTRTELCGLNSLDARNIEIYGREDVRLGVQHEYRFSGVMFLKSTQRALYKFSESVGALIGSWPEPSHGRISECPRQLCKDQRQVCSASIAAKHWGQYGRTRVTTNSSDHHRSHGSESVGAELRSPRDGADSDRFLMIIHGPFDCFQISIRRTDTRSIRRGSGDDKETQLGVW
jgi:hypothetical protein